MKGIIRKLIYSEIRKRRKGYFRPNHPIHKSNDFSKSWKDIFLVLAGGLIGVLGNQIFYQKNKMTDADIDLRKELVKMQYPYLNRIIHFSYTYKTTTQTFITTKRTLIADSSHGKFKVLDSVWRDIDSVSFTCPSFVVDTIERKKLYDDITEVRKNKDYIDQRVWIKFEKLTNLMDKYPFPESNRKDLAKSDWIKQEIQNEWEKKLDDLFSEAWYVMHSIDADVENYVTTKTINK